MVNILALYRNKNYFKINETNNINKSQVKQYILKQMEGGKQCVPVGRMKHKNKTFLFHLHTV